MIKHNSPFPFCLSLVWVIGKLCSTCLPAAVVSSLGYTNNFTVQPSAADWATTSRAGGAADSYDPNSDLNANITSAAVTAPTILENTNPPAANAAATWSSVGQYLQTRPTGNRYTVLMGKLTNGTGTNATQVSISYSLVITGGGVVEEAGKGTRVYYSLTGLANSWTNLPALNTVANSGTFALSTNISISWSNGNNFYLAWVDDNANGNPTDSACQIDNFSMRVTGGSPVITELRLALSQPTNGAVFVSGATVLASAQTMNGTAPFTVEYFTNGGPVNMLFASAGSSSTAPFEVPLANLTAGAYRIYAALADATLTSTNTVTNTFFIADPLQVTLTAPVDGAQFDTLTSVTGKMSVADGTPPYAVQFYLDDSPVGAPIPVPPYEIEFGSLFVGEHRIRVTVADSNGWTSNSLVHSIYVTGPLNATLLPTNGSAFFYGQSLVLTAHVAGGVSPYAATFFLNDQPTVLNEPPFSINVGVLSPGSYTSYVYATDSSLPAQAVFSGTNLLTVVSNPLSVTLTSPTNGQTAIAGQSIALSATAAVNAPLTVRGVEFFYNGISVGLDTNAPFIALVTNPAAGMGTFHAIATDSLQQTSTSAVSVVNFIIDPLANDNFANRPELTTPATVIAANVPAARQMPLVHLPGRALPQFDLRATGGAILEVRPE